MEGRRILFLTVLLAAIVIGSALEISGMYRPILNASFSELPSITRIFELVVILLGAGNVLLAVAYKESKEPYGSTLSFARAFGPLGGAVFNISSAGYLAYTCFLTATTMFQADFSGALGTVLPSQTIGLILNLMYIILAFSAYSVYSLFRLIWIHPILQKRSPLKVMASRKRAAP